MKHHKGTRILIVAILLVSGFDASARCRRVAEVKYQQQYGWSRKYTVEVSFMSGYELNQVTSSFNYDGYAKYAIIFWQQNQATVIKLSSMLICGMEITCDCIENTLMDLQGYDQDGDKWNLCLRDYCS